MSALSGVAFPTVSSTSGEPAKSLLTDVAGDSVVSATATYAIYPISERKGKFRSGFIAVHATLFEIHKSQKDFKIKKLAKYFIDFADVFNVCIQNEPTQIKGECIAIMEPADTYLFKPTDSEYSIEAWYDYILEKARECRCNKLARPVFHDEYFEASWDVMIIKRPKLRKEYSKQTENCDDLVIKRPTMEGRRRLCICSTSFLLFDMEAKPTYNPDGASFDKQSFIDLPLNVISNYGCQEKFFFIRIGRCSEIGSGELWMSSESGSAAKSMHEKINIINIRESDRRRVQGVKINYPTISSRVLKSRAHRERSQTANQLHKSDSNSKLKVVQLSDSDKTSKNSSCRSIATNLSVELNGSGSYSQFLSSIPEKVRDEFTSVAQPKKSSIAGLLPFRISRMSNASMSSTAGDQPLHSPSSTNPDSMTLSSAAANRLSASTKHSKAMLGNRQLDSGSKLDRISIDGGCTHSQYNCAEDYMTYDASDSGTNHLNNFNKFLAEGADQSRKSSTTFSGIIMNQMPVRQYSMGSNSIAASDSHTKIASNSSSNTPKDYLEMDVNTLSTNIYRPEMVFPLQEVRSYVSNSTESCWSPHSSEGASNVPRAYSLGSRPTKMLPKHQQELEENEDGKRAISSKSVTLPLGSPARAQPYSCLSPPKNRPTTTPNDSYTSLNVSVTVDDKQAENLQEDPLTRPTIVNWRGKVADATVTTASPTVSGALDTEDMRKRAHSVGSKSWIKQATFLRKMTGKKSVAATSTTAEASKTEIICCGAGLESEGRDRADSTGSRSSIAASNFDTHSRRNTNRSTASHPDSQDHVEIDFDRDGSCASTESPLNRSRNSSVGVQMPCSVRSALELALSTHHHHRMHFGEKPSDRFINLGKADQLIQPGNIGEPQVVRKRSVPEMAVLDINSCVADNQSSHQQPSTSQRRRSTYDCTSAASSLSTAAQLARFRAKSNTNHHLLHPTPSPSSGKPITSLSTSSGVSSRSSEPSIANLPSTTPTTDQLQGEEEEDDYVIMGTDLQSTPNQPRLISTIIESAYSSSTNSLASSSSSESSILEEDKQKNKPNDANLLLRSIEMPLSRVIVDKSIKKEEDSEDYGIIVPAPTCSRTKASSPLKTEKKGEKELKCRSKATTIKLNNMFVARNGSEAVGPSTSPIRHRKTSAREEIDVSMIRKLTYGGMAGGPMVGTFRKHSSSSCSRQTLGSRKHKAVEPKKEQCDYAVVQPSVGERGDRKE